MVQRLRQQSSYRSKAKVWRTDFRSKILSIRYVENCDAGGVPGATSQHTFARDVIVITIVVIGIRMLAAVSAVNRLRPLGHIASHVINAVAIRLVFRFRLMKTNYSNLGSGILSPVVPSGFVVADVRAQAVIKIIRSARRFFPFSFSGE